jgi:hypothetical protein
MALATRSLIAGMCAVGSRNGKDLPMTTYRVEPFIWRETFMSLKSTPPRRINTRVQRARRGFGLTPRRLIPAGLVAVVASLLFAPGAQASPILTQSAITSPSGPYYVLDQGQTQTVTISGTTNVDDAGGDVDIGCYQDDGSSGTEVDVVAPNVTVQGDGSFSVTVPIANLGTSNTSQLCRLRAVDSDNPPPTTGLNAFTGPQTAYSYLQTSVNGSELYDFYLYEQQLTAAADYDSLGGCGLDDSYTQDATGAQIGSGFDCNDWTNQLAQSDASNSGITVDGEPAYAPDTAEDATNSAAGLPAITLDSVTQDPTNGDVTLVETDPIVFCQGNPAPASISGCATFIPAGVQDTRTITQTDDGHVVLIHDAYSSTDGSAHSVDLLLENDQAFSPTTGGGDQDYLFPGQSAWVQPTGGETETMPAGAIGTTYVRDVNFPDGELDAPLGAITYFQAPSAPLAFSTQGGNGNETFDAPANLSVPASGSATLDYAYATDTTLDALNSEVASSKDDVVPPAVTIAQPADGATVSSSPVTVSGTASAGSGVQGLTVDGSAVTVANDGSWTTSLTPTLGAQTITVTVTSQAGNTASTHESFTYTPPATTSSTTSTTTTATPSPAGVDQTTASRKVRGQSAVLGASTVTYHFQYGRTGAYGHTTGSQTLPASTTATTVGIAARRLIPGSRYHYRLVVTDSAGQISYGADMVVRTPRVKPRRIRDHITAYWAQHAPYGYRLDGRLVLSHGLTKKVGCKTRGTATVTVVTQTGHTIAHRRLKVTAQCTYHGALSFAAAKLPGSGRLAFHIRFGGNRQLRGHSARTLNVLYGPRKVTG